jgi:MFS transporter, DHA1 family, quinolone resistance protein
VAIYSGTTVLLELPTGGLADSLGRKRVYMMAVAVHLMALVVFLGAYDYFTVALAALILGVGRSLSSGSMDAWFVDEFTASRPHSDLQGALAKANAVIPLGLGVGSLIGGVIPMTLGGALHGILGSSVYSANLMIAAVVDIIQLVLTSFLIKETVWVPRIGGVKEGFRDVPRVVKTSVTYGVKDRTLSMLLLTILALGFGIAGLELLWQPRVTALIGSGSNTWILGVLAAGYFLTTSVGSVLITPICSRLNNDLLLVMAILTAALGAIMITLSAQASIATFTLFYLLTYLVMGMSSSPYGTLYNSQVPSEHRSTMLSFQSLVAQAGGLVGSVILGWVAGVAGIPSAWALGGGVVAISSLGFIVLIMRRRRGTVQVEEPRQVTTGQADRAPPPSP